MGEVEMAVRLGDAENDTIVGSVASPLIQRHQIMRRPGPLMSPPVFVDHVQVFAAFRTTAVLSDESCILRAVVELHLFALRLTFESP